MNLEEIKKGVIEVEYVDKCRCYTYKNGTYFMMNHHQINVINGKWICGKCNKEVILNEHKRNTRTRIKIVSKEAEDKEWTHVK